MSFPKRFEPHVTDHAVVRWLEHVHGLDARDVRREILGENRGDWVAEGTLMIHVPRLRVSLVNRDGAVVTVLTHDGKEGRYVPQEVRSPR